MAGRPANKKRIPYVSLNGGHVAPGAQRTFTSEYRKGVAGWFEKSQAKKFAAARTWAGENELVAMILRVKQDMVLEGFSVVPQRNSAQALRFHKAWLRDESGEDFCRRLAGDVAAEYLALDTVVVSGTDEGFPHTLQPECCEYSDAGGIEVLKYRHGLTPTKIREMAKELGLTTAEETAMKLRYSRETVRIADPGDPDAALSGEWFSVLTRGRRGFGFGDPRMYSLFRVLDQWRSMETGEAALAWLGQRVSMQHKLGTEPKAANQGRVTPRVRKEDIEEVSKQYGDKIGSYTMVTRYDHEIVVNYVDPKLFESKRWDTVLNRVMWWGGPLAMALFANMQVSDQLERFLVNEIVSLREELARFLTPIFNRYAATPVQIRFAKRPLFTVRQYLEGVRALIPYGPVSHTSAAESMGFNFAEEVARKRKEVEMVGEDRHFLGPHYDAAHGPDGGPDAKGGRPPGTKDPGS